MTKKQKILTLISLVCNVSIIGFVIGAFIYSCFLTGENALMAKGFSSLRFYTVLSNVLLAILSLPILVIDIICLKKNKYEAPSWAGILKYVGVVGVSVTFLTVICFLAPGAAKRGQGYWSLFQGPNLYYHLIVPLLAIVSFGFIELNITFKMGYTALGLVSVVLYGIFYIINYYCHLLDDGNGSYDWYGFLSDPKRSVWFVALIMLLASYLICVCLYFLHRLFVGFTLAKTPKPIEENSYIVKDSSKKNKENHILDPIEDNEDIKGIFYRNNDESGEKEYLENETETKSESKETSEKDDNEEIDVEIDSPSKKQASAKLPTQKINTYNGKARTYHISKVPDKGWQVKLATGKKAIKYFPTQNEAINYAKSLADTQGGSIRIHSKKGKIRK